jgi:hypothetical protein
VSGQVKPFRVRVTRKGQDPRIVDVDRVELGALLQKLNLQPISAWIDRASSEEGSPLEPGSPLGRLAAVNDAVMGSEWHHLWTDHNTDESTWAWVYIHESARRASAPGDTTAAR